MPTRNVVLIDHQAHFVEQLATAGRYQNASEVLRDAASVGVADIETGNYRSFDSADILARYLAALTTEIINT